MQYPDFYTEEMVRVGEANRILTAKLLDVPKGYHMHHKNEDDRYLNPFRYIRWLPEDLEVCTDSEHIQKHNQTGKRAERISESHKGKKCPWMSKWNKLHKTGTKDSEETRAKKSIAASGGNNPRAVHVRCIETGEIFECVKYANKKYGIKKGAISGCCKGVFETAGGYHWEYI